MAKSFNDLTPGLGMAVAGTLNRLNLFEVVFPLVDGMVAEGMTVEDAVAEFRMSFEDTLVSVREAVEEEAGAE